MAVDKRKAAEQEAINKRRVRNVKNEGKCKHLAGFASVGDVVNMWKDDAAVPHINSGMDYAFPRIAVEMRD
ncbi:hypothetical protein TNCT_543711 [Trichonephila clavata]|uniref:Uncharacterized protein n=1 Tax=Trichonephila clavata TaxID=2740835 RepID=A0A8X6FL95_TRICU|nr:hypothetical protein TNCT_543711 [Trichonephila clavata]